MKRLLAFVAFLGVFTVIAAASPPPVDRMIEGQHPRPGGDLELGSRNGLANGQTGQVRMKGPLIIEQPILPGNSAGILIDGGVSVNGNMTLRGGVVTIGVIDAGALYVQGGGPVTRILPFNTGAFDFASTTTTCNETGAITVTGAQANDSCIVGPPSTGGSANAAYTCYVSATNQVKVRHCAVGTADDPASATFFGVVISAQ